MFNCSTISMFTLSSHCLFVAPPIGLGPTFRCPLWHQWQIWSPPPQRANIVQSCVDLVCPKTQVSLWKCHRFRQSSPAGFPGAWNWRRRRNISHCSLVSFMVALHSIYSILRHPHLSFIYMKSQGSAASTLGARAPSSEAAAMLLSLSGAGTTTAWPSKFL